VMVGSINQSLEIFLATIAVNGVEVRCVGWCGRSPGVEIISRAIERTNTCNRVAALICVSRASLAMKVDLYPVEVSRSASNPYEASERKKGKRKKY